MFRYLTENWDDRVRHLKSSFINTFAQNIINTVALLHSCHFTARLNHINLNVLFVFHLMNEQ